MKSLLPLIFASWLVVSTGNAAKVLLLPAPAHSHVMEQLPIGEKLAKVFGHEVHIMMHKTHKLAEKYKKAGIKVIQYGDDKALLMETKAFQIKQMMSSISATSESGTDSMKMVQTFKAATDEMKSTMLDESVFKALKEKNFDFVIADGLFFFRYVLVIPHRLKVPYGCVMAGLPLDLPSQLMRLPSTEMSDEAILDYPMSFFDRIRNVQYYLKQAFVLPYFMDQDKYLQTYAQDDTIKTTRELAIKAKFWIVDKSPLLIASVPRAPNVFIIGGISGKPVEPLAAEVKSFADGATKGFVVVSFGSIVKYLSARYLNELAVAFGKMPELKFIWRLNVKLDVPIPSNVKTMTWLPQNDLLAHKNAKAFITHCGSNGITEALTHGVPMVGMPIQFDQPTNCHLMKGRGYGVVLSITKYTSVTLKEALEEVISNPSYAKKIKFASSIIKTNPNPSEKAASIVDHVIKFGGDHIANAGGELYWFQILMWDFALVLFVSLLVLLFCFGYLIRKCCGKSQNKAKQE